MAEERDPRGKYINQKLKTYLVMQYFLKNTDERHPAMMQDILLYLNEDCGIDAERRSIYSDIKEINKILYMLDHEEEGCTIEEAEEALAEDEAEKYIISGETNRSGYYLTRRPHGVEVDDIRLLAECVYNAKFISEKKAKELIDVVSTLVNQWDSAEIKHDAILVGRVKTTNSKVLSNIGTINYAMRRSTSADPHLPEKITFKYQKYSIDDVTKMVDRRKGAPYKVSPYRLLINDGNYYLLAFDDRAQEMRTYRVDRMKSVSLTGEPRDGEEEYAELAKEIGNYTQRVFGMFGGKRVRLTLRFANSLLDTAIERFGTKGLKYSKFDENHFTVNPEVEISDQFFGWLCGFGNKVKIIAPDFAIEDFTAYLNKIRATY